MLVIVVLPANAPFVPVPDPDPVSPAIPTILAEPSQIYPLLSTCDDRNPPSLLFASISALISETVLFAHLTTYAFSGSRYSIVKPLRL